MGLRRKNLVYSLGLAGVLMLFLLGYFMYMLPSLYVDYVMEQNLKSVRQQHTSYMQNGTYDGVSVRNSAACFSMEIPFEGESFLVTGKSFSAEVIVKDERLSQVLARCQEKTRFQEDGGKDSVGFRPQGELGSLQTINLQPEMEELGDIIKEALEGDLSLPVEIRPLYHWDWEEEFFNEKVKLHFYSDTMFILEASVEDSANQYVNYIAIEQRPESLVFTYLPMVAPDMDEIRPIVLQSLPMLGAVILLMVLLSSQMYSKGIVVPIVKLVQRAGQMEHTLPLEDGRIAGNADENYSGKNTLQAEDMLKQQEDGQIKRQNKKDHRQGRDEIAELEDILETFYQQIRENLCKLEEKNKELVEENKRQEIFLRASSHQLKTPIAAALLLVEGMMNEIGRYKDTKIYLPKVKEQLLSMRKMVEDILYLNHCEENMHSQWTQLYKLLEERLRAYQVSIVEKRLLVEFAGEESLTVYTDEMMFSQILDNLLSNGVKYTPAGGRIRIAMYQEGTGGEIRLENFGTAIPEELLPHIFEPFVSGHHGLDTAGTHSHGLGLYLASYYAKKLGINLSVHNGEDCVIAVLVIK